VSHPESKSIEGDSWAGGTQFCANRPLPRGAPAMQIFVSCTALRENGKMRHIPSVEEFFSDLSATRGS
jgi:hypothetical protein